MHKFRFLCAAHQTWLRDNPLSATSLWQRSQQRGQELAEEEDFVDAARHAGTAFETAGILLARAARPQAADIRRFTDSCALLVELLHRLGEQEAARNMTSAAVTRMEQLLLQGVERSAVLAACQRLLYLGDGASLAARGAEFRSAAALH